MRYAGLIVALIFIALLGVLTAIELARNGLTPLGLVSVLVLAMFGIGVFGAIRNPPDR